jgi:hypothetical protein
MQPSPARVLNANHQTRVSQDPKTGEKTRPPAPRCHRLKQHRDTVETKQIARFNTSGSRKEHYNPSNQRDLLLQVVVRLRCARARDAALITSSRTPPSSSPIGFVLTEILLVSQSVCLKVDGHVRRRHLPQLDYFFKIE